MGPAETIRVKISSEAAGAVAITPVVARDMTLLELVEEIASISVEPARVRDLLKRGSLVSGASRFRWQPLEVAPEEAASLVELLPKPEPRRPFDSARCNWIVLVAGARRWALTPEAASRRGIVQALQLKPSFWKRLLAACPDPAYRSYSYRDRADLYSVELTGAALEAVRAAAASLPYPALRAEILSARLTAVEWLVRR